MKCSRTLNYSLSGKLEQRGEKASSLLHEAGETPGKHGNHNIDSNIRIGTCNLDSEDEKGCSKSDPCFGVCLA